MGVELVFVGLFAECSEVLLSALFPVSELESAIDIIMHDLGEKLQFLRYNGVF